MGKQSPEETYFKKRQALAGKRGGKATLERHGKEHFRRIARKKAKR